MEPTILHATLEKLGGRKHTTWQTRACTLDRDSLRWKSRGTGGHAIPLTDVESTHGGRADEAAALLGKPPERVLVVQCKPGSQKGEKRYFLAAASEPERDEWHSALARFLHELAPASEREEISFPGAIVAGQFGHHGTMCTCSFPGEYKAAWEKLTDTAEDGGLSTACVFLTAADQGRHCDNPETGECWCCALYGEPKPWGCEWFEKWKILVTEAVEKGQMIIVFYKAGHLARVGAEHTSFPTVKQVEGEVEWVDLSSSSFEQLKAMPGLGASQRGRWRT